MTEKSRFAAIRQRDFEFDFEKKHPPGAKQAAKDRRFLLQLLEKAEDMTKFQTWRCSVDFKLDQYYGREVVFVRTCVADNTVTRNRACWKLSVLACDLGACETFECGCCPTGKDFFVLSVKIEEAEEKL